MRCAFNDADQLSINDVWEHLESLSAIAEANDGHRSAGSPGYVASLDYVSNAMETAGYLVEIDSFEYASYEVLEAPTFEQMNKNARFGYTS